MPLWKKTDELRPGMTTQPILWTSQWDHLSSVPLPDVTAADVQSVFGDDGTGKRLQTFGHMNGNYRDGRDPHLIAIRSGYGMHHDPGFVRYTHHVVLLNEGFHVNGLSGFIGEPMGFGAMYAIDSHSPHQVIPDPRLGDGRLKIQLAVDADSPLGPVEVVQKLEPFVPQVLDMIKEKAAA